MVKGEIITLGAAATAIGGAYKLSEFMYKAKRVRDVGPSNAVYVRIIGRVRSDLDEVRRLLSVREVHDALESNPEKSRWVYGVMRDVRGALENITPHTERVSGDIEAGRRIGVRHRLYWLLSEREKLENREKELNVAHNSLIEVLGYLTTLEPIELPKKPQSIQKETTNIDIDINTRETVQQPQQLQQPQQPQYSTERIEREREVFIERDSAPRRVEERDVYVERDHRHGHPTHHHEEHRDVHYDERGNRVYVERDVHIERSRDPRDHRDVRYEAEFDERYEQGDQYERRPYYPEERRRDERPPFPQPLGRRPESFEDRLPERDTWMQSEARRPQGRGRGNPYGEYAEYGAPQPVGAAHYKRRFQGDPGFGDEEIQNPQPVPLSQEFQEREVWIEQKEDYRYDQYGNRLPDRFFQPPVPRPYRSRM